MAAPLIDLRSDTVTRPTPGMWAAMTAADLGDDVFGEDPTVNRLEAATAELLGTEAAVFVPSGTMANQIAVKVHTRPGDEMLCEATCHMYVWEAGGPATLSGVTCRTIAGDYGVLDVAQMKDLIRPGYDYYPRTRLVALENTHNRGGGRVYPQAKVREIADWAHANGLLIHLDGARLWNAHVASGVPLSELCRPFDSISVCFSKGLGAPIGSALAGSKAFIAEARRVRKLLGGGMRQAGVIAAAALYAVKNNIGRLADDHANAKVIAAAVEDTPGLRLDPALVETNLVWMEVDPALAPAPTVAARLHEKGVLVHAAGPTTLRACTHLDVTAAQAALAADALRQACR
jgi:threonine aldolase